MGRAVNPFVDSLIDYLLFTVLPFNLIKYGIASFLTYLVYKKASVALTEIVNVLIGKEKLMEYGKIDEPHFVVCLEGGDEIHDSLVAFVEKEHITFGMIQGIGTVREVIAIFSP